MGTWRVKSNIIHRVAIFYSMNYKKRKERFKMSKQKNILKNNINQYRQEKPLTKKGIVFDKK